MIQNVYTPCMSFSLINKLYKSPLWWLGNFVILVVNWRQRLELWNCWGRGRAQCSLVVLSKAVDWCICFTRKIQHGGDWERSRPQGPKNVHNFDCATSELSMRAWNWNVTVAKTALGLEHSDADREGLMLGTGLHADYLVWGLFCLRHLTTAAIIPTSAISQSRGGGGVCGPKYKLCTYLRRIPGRIQ